LSWRYLRGWLHQMMMDELYVHQAGTFSQTFARQAWRMSSALTRQPRRIC